MNIAKINGEYINLSDISSISALKFFDDQNCPKGLGKHGARFTLLHKSGHKFEIESNFTFIFGMSTKLIGDIPLDDSYMTHFIKKVLNMSHNDFAKNEYFRKYWNTSDDKKSHYPTPPSLGRYWECEKFNHADTIAMAFKMSVRDNIKKHYNELVDSWIIDIKSNRNNCKVYHF